MSQPAPSFLSGKSLAFLLLRGWLGIRSLLAGIEKYSSTVKVQKPLIDPITGMEDPSGAMLDITQKVYGWNHYHALPQALQDKFALEPLLPRFAIPVFYMVLGPLLILLGLMLLLGIGTRISLVLQGALYIILSGGLLLLNQSDGVAWLGIHMGLIAMALVLVENNCFSILKKW